MTASNARTPVVAAPPLQSSPFATESPRSAQSVVVDVADRDIPGPHGDLRLRTYVPQSTGSPAVGLVWSHGGGFAYGDLDMPEADRVARNIAQHGIPVISVGYRLAPRPTGFPEPGTGLRRGHTFPVASEEVSAAFEWSTTTDEFGVAPTRWSLGGASAGANLSAGAVLRLLDEGRTSPRSLVLAYPTVHATLPALEPALAVTIASLPPELRFSPDRVAAINLNYVGDTALLASRYAFPGTHDLHGMPPTFILNSDHDGLRASGQLFASELAHAGVDVLQVREKGTHHGHLNEPDNPAFARSVRRIVAWLVSNSPVFQP